MFRVLFPWYIIRTNIKYIHTYIYTHTHAHEYIFDVVGKFLQWLPVAPPPRIHLFFSVKNKLGAAFKGSTYVIRPIISYLLSFFWVVLN